MNIDEMAELNRRATEIQSGARWSSMSRDDLVQGWDDMTKLANKLTEKLKSYHDILAGLCKAIGVHLEHCQSVGPSWELATALETAQNIPQVKDLLQG